MKQSFSHIKLKEYGQLIARYKKEDRASDFEKAIAFFISLELNQMQQSDSKDLIQDCVVHIMNMDTRDKPLGIICNRLKQIFYSMKRKQNVRSKRVILSDEDKSDETFGIPNHKFIDAALDASKIEVDSLDYDLIMNMCNYSGYGERYISKKHKIGYGRIKKAKCRIQQTLGIY